ncbi:mCG146846 [Mus musculus]|nr:mCG146846 [Mus musculus]
MWKGGYSTVQTHLTLGISTQSQTAIHAEAGTIHTAHQPKSWGETAAQAQDGPKQ